MSGLVNGVLAGTGAFEICNRFDSERELQQRDFFGLLRDDETDPSLISEWFRRSLAIRARIAGRGPRP